MCSYSCLVNPKIFEFSTNLFAIIQSLLIQTRCVLMGEQTSTQPALWPLVANMVAIVYGRLLCSSSLCPCQSGVPCAFELLSLYDVSLSRSSHWRQYGCVSLFCKL